MNHQNTAAAQRYRVELLLMGMLLAKTGDRAAILEAIEPEAIANNRLRMILKGVAESDPVPVYAALDDMGVRENGNVLTSLLERHKEMRTEDKMRDVVATIMTSNLIEDRHSLRQRLEEAMAELDRTESVVASNAMEGTP